MTIIFNDDKILISISIALIAAYLVRVTIPSVWLYPIAPDLVNFAGFAFLFLAAAYLFSRSGMQINQLSFMLIVLLIITTTLSVDLDIAISRAVLWGLVFVVAGPFFTSPQAIVLREHLWDKSKYIVISVTAISFIWISLRLPQFGKGVSGITMHSMLLGAIAGLASVISFSNLLALTVRSLFSWGLFITSALTCLLAGSRTAVLAAIAGCVAVVIMRLPGMMVRAVAFASMTILVIMSWFLFDIGDADMQNMSAASDASHIYLSELAKKGSINSRQQLWSNRIEEFTESPIVGVGIGVDTFITTKNAFGAKIVEPGSSYLAIISMTGIVGATGLALLLFSLIHQVITRNDMIKEKDLAQAAGVGVFWAIHGIAEGWIFAGGSLLCLLFWIWVGRLANLAGALPEDQRVLS
jgi:hypothetical protein